MLADQEALLAEGRKIVLEEQKRFVGWEKALNEREESIARRAMLSPSTVESSAPPMTIAPEPMPEPMPEPVPEIEPEVEIMTPAPEPREMEATPVVTPSAPVAEVPIEEDEAPTPVFKAEPAVEVKAETVMEDEEPETPVFRADSKPVGPSCPACSNPVSEVDATCSNCGHQLNEVPKLPEVKEKTEVKEEGTKKHVAVRKIIRRK